MPRFALLFLFVLGCSSPESDPAPRLGAATPAPALPSIEGRVRYTGPLQDAVLPADPRFAHCLGGPAGQLVVGGDRGLAGVLVHVPGEPLKPGELSLRATACRFEPASSIVATGSRLIVSNDDPLVQTFHVRRLDGQHERAEQNLAVPPGSPPLHWTLDRPGRYRIVSVERPWMEAWVQVIDGGVGLRSDSEGRFDAPLGPGDHEVSTWHPLLGVRRHGVTVPQDGPASLYVDWSELGEDARAPTD